jgi:excinuclease UvrABC nuclease subunit
VDEVVAKFTKITGLGKSKAIALYEAGYYDYESLRSGSVSDIGKVKGIGNTLAKNIKSQLKKKKFKDA